MRDTFRFVQGRNPTSAEQQAGEDALAGGMSRGAWVAARAEAASAQARLEPEVYVTMTYIGMLGRVPDLGGYDFWVGRVRGGTLDPAPDLQLPAEQRVRHPRHLSPCAHETGARRSPGPRGTGPGLLRLCDGVPAGTWGQAAVRLTSVRTWVRASLAASRLCLKRSRACSGSLVSIWSSRAS